MTDDSPSMRHALPDCCLMRSSSFRAGAPVPVDAELRRHAQGTSRASRRKCCIAAIAAHMLVPVLQRWAKFLRLWMCITILHACPSAHRHIPTTPSHLHAEEVQLCDVHLMFRDALKVYCPLPSHRGTRYQCTEHRSLTYSATVVPQTRSVFGSLGSCQCQRGLAARRRSRRTMSLRPELRAKLHGTNNYIKAHAPQPVAAVGAFYGAASAITGHRMRISRSRVGRPALRPARCRLAAGACSATVIPLVGCLAASARFPRLPHVVRTRPRYYIL
jgi:hypothetical protein